MARKRGGLLTAIDGENTKIVHRLASPKRAQHGMMLDPHQLQRWHTKQSKHMRRSCQLPYVMGAGDGAQRRSKRRSELAALADSTDNAAHVLDAFQHMAASRIYETDTGSLLDTTNEDHAM